MRIVHVLTRLLRAGSEENTLASCRAQAAANHEVYVVHGREFDPRWYETLSGEVNLIRIDSLVHPLAPIDDLRAFVAMRRLFRDLKPSIVHTHQSKAGIVGRFAAKAAGVPNIVHGVHIVPFVNVGLLQKAIYLTAERAAGAITDEFIDVSRGVREMCLAAGVGRIDNHHVIHSGFELRRFRNASLPEDWREILGIGPHEEKPPVVVMLAALEPRKRHCEFIEALPRIIALHPQMRLVMPGEGQHREAIVAKIAELGLQKHVRLIGYRTDPEKIIALADVCTLTSTREGLPRVVMQYIAGGRACVVTDLPGLDEVIHHGENGLVVPADDIDAAADAIAALLSDRAELARLSAGAAACDMSSWDVENMCNLIERIYQRMDMRHHG